MKSKKIPLPNIALRIESYDLEKRITTGYDLTSGEKIKIKLSEPAYPGRMDIEDWSKAVVAGNESKAGVIIFEAVQPSNIEGVMEARCTVTAANFARDASVLKVYARPIAKRGAINQRSDFIGVDIFDANNAVSVNSISEIKEQIKSILEAQYTRAVVRIKKGDKVESSVISRLYTDELKELEKIIKDGENTREGKKAEFKIANKNSIEQAAANFLEIDPIGQSISKLNPEELSTLSIEVVTLKKVYASGVYSRVINERNSFDRLILERDWAMEDGKGFGFAESYVAIYDVAGECEQLKRIRQTSTLPSLFAGLNDIPTKNIQPSAVKLFEKNDTSDTVKISQSNINNELVSNILRTCAVSNKSSIAPSKTAP